MIRDKQLWKICQTTHIFRFTWEWIFMHLQPLKSMDWRLTSLIVSHEVEINAIVLGAIRQFFVNFMKPKKTLDLCTWILLNHTSVRFWILETISVSQNLYYRGKKSRVTKWSVMDANPYLKIIWTLSCITKILSYVLLTTSSETEMVCHIRKISSVLAINLPKQQQESSLRQLPNFIINPSATTNSTMKSKVEDTICVTSSILKYVGEWLLEDGYSCEEISEYEKRSYFYH